MNSFFKTDAICSRRRLSQVCSFTYELRVIQFSIRPSFVCVLVLVEMGFGMGSSFVVVVEDVGECDNCVLVSE